MVVTVSGTPFSVLTSSQIHAHWEISLDLNCIKDLQNKLELSESELITQDQWVTLLKLLNVEELYRYIQIWRHKVQIHLWAGAFTVIC